MSEILLRATSTEKRNSVGYSFAIVLGIVGIVLAVILLAGGKRAPEGADMIAVFAGPLGLILLIWAIWLYFDARGDMFITKSGNKYGITFVSSKKQKTIEIYSPFTIKCFHDLQRVNKYQRAYFLYMLIYDKDGELVVTLEAASPAIFGEPEGWNPLFKGDLDEVTTVYTCSHITDARKILRQFVK